MRKPSLSSTLLRSILAVRKFKRRIFWIRHNNGVIYFMAAHFQLGSTRSLLYWSCEKPENVFARINEPFAGRTRDAVILIRVAYSTAVAGWFSSGGTKIEDNSV